LFERPYEEQQSLIKQAEAYRHENNCSREDLRYYIYDTSTLPLGDCDELAEWVFTFHNENANSKPIWLKPY
jgi:hypothetical protein